MKFRSIVLAVLLLLTGGASVFAAADCGCTFQVNTPNHTQQLGGNSGVSSHGGLHTAASSTSVVVHVQGSKG